MQAMHLLPGVEPGAQAWEYVAATLQAPLLLVGQRQCLRSGLPLRALRSSTGIDVRRHERQ